MRSFAFETAKLNQIEYTRDELVALVQNAIDTAGVKVSASSVIDDVTLAVPLFVDEGSSFRWGHRAFQDYFAAQAICIDAKAEQSTILKTMYRQQRCLKYSHVLDLCWDIDPKAFRHSVLDELVVDCINHHEALRKNLQSGISPNDLLVRASVSFGRGYIFTGRWSSSVATQPHSQARIDLEGETATEIRSVPAGRVRILPQRGWDLLPLLAYRGDPLLQSTSTWREQYQSAAESGVDGLVRVLGDRTVPIDSGRDSPLNEPAVFRLVTSQLLYLVDHYVCYDECVRLRAAIVAERQRDAADGGWLLNL